jgi:nucleoside-diphosphate-sugar epimerase
MWDLRKKRVLVTGGAVFLGSHLREKLFNDVLKKTIQYFE